MKHEYDAGSRARCRQSIKSKGLKDIVQAIAKLVGVSDSAITTDNREALCAHARVAHEVGSSARGGGRSFNIAPALRASGFMRALLKRPRVLVFDEATSNLDQPTADSFAKTVNALKGQVTMLFITHALPRSLQVDEVIQLTKEGAQRMQVVLPKGAKADTSQANAHE